MRKLASYMLISFLSFGVSTTLFHTVANAQTSDLIVAPSIFPSTKPTVPTPTFVKKAEQANKSAVKFSLQSVELPTPTIVLKKAEPTPTSAKQQIAAKATVKAAVVEVTPTAVPTIPPADPTPTTAPVEKPAVAAPAELDPLFTKYADEYQISKNDLVRIAKCEAGFRAEADTGLYAGMYQFHAQTWASTRNAMGLDPNPDLRKNAEESIKTAAFKIKNGGRSAWPNC